MEEAIPILTQAVGGLALTVKNQNLSHITAYIGQYDGNPSKFKEWIRTMDKYNRLNGHNDVDKVKLAHMTSRGAVSDFIMRWQDEHVNNINWDDLLSSLTTHFSDVTDAEHARALLRTVKQGPHESVTIYVERLYNLAQEAYKIGSLMTPEGRSIVARQLINHFVEGLAEDSMKMKVMRRNPQTLEDALEIALGEQNLLRRFNNLGMRKNFVYQRHQVDQKNNSRNNYQRDIPMEVDHARRKQCPVCLRYGHTASQCRQRQINEISPTNERVRLCYFCRSPDHLRRDCEQFKRRKQKQFERRGNQYVNVQQQYKNTQRRSEN